jgi:hypothetical protein
MRPGNRVSPRLAAPKATAKTEANLRTVESDVWTVDLVIIFVAPGNEQIDTKIARFWYGGLITRCAPASG